MEYEVVDDQKSLLMTPESRNTFPKPLLKSEYTTTL